MKIRIEDGLPFVSISISFQQRQLELDNVIIDIGSAETILKFGSGKSIGISQETDDEIHRICGGGGKEFEFAKRIDRISLNDAIVEDFQVEIGAMEYGFAIEGILGLDFLTQIGAIIDLKELQIRT